MKQSKKQLSADLESGSEAVVNKARESTDIVPGDEMAAVRDLLFGAQVKQNNQKHAELEQLILSSMSQLRTDTDTRLAQIEEKISALGDSLSFETEQRNKGGSEFSQELNTLMATIEKVDSASSDAQADLQDQLLNHADLMQKNMDELHSELSAALQKECSKLNRDKADRSSLAVLLNGIANQLSGGDVNVEPVEG